MPLCQPLRPQQIDAAGQFHRLLPQWQLSDAALLRLRTSVPGFSEDACLLKAVAVNALYGTQVYAIVRMARHTCQVMTKMGPNAAGPELVEAIAGMSAKEGDTAREHTSFASKFCHFFVDEEGFPIYDEAARQVLRLHLGRSYAADNTRAYATFCTNLQRLRTEAQIRCTGRELDRYLWVTGVYMKWLSQRGRAKPQMNAELRAIFEKPSGDAAVQLQALLPAALQDAASVVGS